MELKQLESLSLAVKLHHYSKVAKQLGVSLPTVINHIQALERELGVELIRKVGNQLHPTSQGLILLDYASRMLQLRDEALEELSQEDVKLSGAIAMASSTTPTESFIHEVISCFKEEYPNIRLNIHYTNSSQVLDELRKNVVDLGFTGQKVEDSTLEFRALEEDKLVLVTPKGEPYDSLKRPLKREDFLNLRFLMREEGSATRETTLAALKERAIEADELNVISELSDTESMKQAIIKGLGVSVLSEKLIQRELNQGLLQVIDLEGGPITRTLYVVKRLNRSDYAHTSLLIQCVEKILKERTTTFS